MSPKSLFLKELALFLKELEVLHFQAGYPKMEVPQFGRYSQALFSAGTFHVWAIAGRLQFWPELSLDCARGGAEDEVAREAQRPTVLRATEALPRKGAG